MRKNVNTVMGIMAVVCVSIAFGILMLAEYSAMSATASIALIVAGIALSWMIRPEPEGEE